jgi:hypothetical protein
LNDSRTHLNTIIQRCTVDLFHSNGIAVAPLPAMALKPGQPKHFRPAGVLAFSSSKISGTLALSLAEGIYGLFTPPITDTGAVHDIVKELTNQLAGRLKNRLLQFQVTLNVGMPSTTTAEDLDKRAGSGVETLYAFRTLRGEVRVTLNGVADDTALRYSNAVNVAQEGEFVAF